MRRAQNVVAVGKAVVVLHQLDIRIIAAGPGGEFGIGEEPGAHHGRTGAIGIGLGGDRQTLRLRLGDHLDRAVDVAQAGRVEVADMHMRPGRTGQADQTDIAVDR